MANANGLAVLPQFQGNYYDLQRQQALAQQLMASSLQGSQPAPAPGVGPYQVQPKYSVGAGLAQLGQALLAARMGKQASQGLNAIGQQQWDYLNNGQTGQPAAAQSPAATQGAVGGAPAGTGQSGPAAQSSAMPSDGSTAQPAGQAPAPQAGPQAGPQDASPFAPGGSANPGGMPKQQALMNYFQLGATEYTKQFVAPYYAPTDVQKMMRSAGVDSKSPEGQQMLRKSIAKTGYIAPVSGRPGASMTLADGTTRYELPAPQPGAMWATNPDGTLLYNQAGQPYQIGIGGADAAAQGMARAKAAGEGSVLPYAGNDVAGNPLPVTNRTAAATQGAGGPPPLPTIPGAGAPAGGGASLPGGPLPGGGSPAPAGPVYAAPPMGATSNANAAQQASADTMKADYTNMQQARQEAPTILQAYDHLTDLANRAPKFVQGGVGGALASMPAAAYLSSDAAEYDKTRAFLISSLGKTLGKNNSDAARATISQMIPEYGKPLPAKLEGLAQGRNQVAVKALRASVLTPAFQSGDSKGYTNLANQFDNNVKPSMMPALQLSGDEQRAAIQAQVKANPSLRSNFEWAFNNGLLK